MLHLKLTLEIYIFIYLIDLKKVYKARSTNYLIGAIYYKGSLLHLLFEYFNLFNYEWSLRHFSFWVIKRWKLSNLKKLKSTNWKTISKNKFISVLFFNDFSLLWTVIFYLIQPIKIQLWLFSKRNRIESQK